MLTMRGLGAFLPIFGMLVSIFADPSVADATYYNNMVGPSDNWTWVRVSDDPDVYQSYQKKSGHEYAGITPYGSGSWSGVDIIQTLANSLICNPEYQWYISFDFMGKDFQCRQITQYVFDPVRNPNDTLNGPPGSPLPVLNLNGRPQTVIFWALFPAVTTHQDPWSCQTAYGLLTTQTNPKNPMLGDLVTPGVNGAKPTTLPDDSTVPGAVWSTQGGVYTYANDGTEYGFDGTSLACLVSS